MCNPQGLMVDDGTMWNLGPERFMFVSGDEEDFGGSARAPRG